ncbi:MAG: urate hydroxylase PuuD [Acidobacteria bacterium]|nr:urate hydroxylase PuuD [Acidobacteriota bacterium]MBI3655716.1 urate hydroxylase PuuD [Acidobacteriota bacterium]
MEVSTLDAYSTYLMALRWLHFVAGITWIGLLYFFNLVNVEFMKKLDGPTKGKVIPELMPRALWWFRWGAVVTVLIGIMYYMSVLKDEPNMGSAIGIWFGVVLVTYAVIYAAFVPTSGPLNKGPILAIVVGLVVVIMMGILIAMLGGPKVSSKSLSIALGGGLGVIMMLNVWGIIWPNQKRIIAWIAANAAQGTAIPPESAKLARQAFLASRANFYLSFPMLFFMGAASHYPWIGFIK